LVAVNPEFVFEAKPQLAFRGLCAHRGASETHPEDKLPAFKGAIRLGAHMIEFDVRLTSDGAILLMHDEIVDRTTDGHGAVADQQLIGLRTGISHLDG
jgi:glycerophosphoryl diester phosphodiesterase